MVVLNGMSRYHLCIEALRRSSRIREDAHALIEECNAMITRAVAYSHEHFEDMPEIRDWTWSDR